MGSRWRAGCWRQGRGGKAVRSRWRAGCWRQGRGRRLWGSRLRLAEEARKERGGCEE